MASALATFLKNVGVSSATLDKCPAFNVKDKTLFKFGSKNKKKVRNKALHTMGNFHFRQWKIPLLSSMVITLFMFDSKNKLREEKVKVEVIKSSYLQWKFPLQMMENAYVPL